MQGKKLALSERKITQPPWLAFSDKAIFQTFSGMQTQYNRTCRSGKMIVFSNLESSIVLEALPLRAGAGHPLLTPGLPEMAE